MQAHIPRPLVWLEGQRQLQDSSRSRHPGLAAMKGKGHFPAVLRRSRGLLFTSFRGGRDLHRALELTD